MAQGAKKAMPGKKVPPPVKKAAKKAAKKIPKKGAGY